MYRFTSISAILLASFTLILTSCDKDDPIIPNEEELITTVNYTLTPTPDNGSGVVVLSFIDLDGDGGNDPVIVGGTLQANSQYTGSLELLNEAESPAENITEEIQEEDEDHQFFFESTVEGLQVSYSDMDDDGKPVGLSTVLTTGAPASGVLTIILKHEPMKSAAGVADGDVTNAQGETDIQVNIPVDVQ